jgi:hypothetical protein
MHAMTSKKIVISGLSCPPAELAFKALNVVEQRFPLVIPFLSSSVLDTA